MQQMVVFRLEIERLQPETEDHQFSHNQGGRTNQSRYLEFVIAVKTLQQLNDLTGTPRLFCKRIAH